MALVQTTAGSVQGKVQQRGHGCTLQLARDVQLADSFKQGDLGVIYVHLGEAVLLSRARVPEPEPWPLTDCVTLGTLSTLPFIK